MSGFEPASVNPQAGVVERLRTGRAHLVLDASLEGLDALHGKLQAQRA
jgi:hypothetical protein